MVGRNSELGAFGWSTHTRLSYLLACRELELDAETNWSRHSMSLTLPRATHARRNAFIAEGGVEGSPSLTPLRPSARSAVLRID